MAFHAPVVNNVRQEPDNNTNVDGWNGLMFYPSEAELCSVQETGEHLVRTINYRLNQDQRNALLFWLEENPEYRWQAPPEPEPEN
tara:strand:- start:139 stop:393 length:255 start_codon:yes stop_codon:yes gene_type:complete